MHALQRVGALLHDHRAGAAFADEADGLDVGMLGQRLAGVLAEAVDEVPHALRQAGLLGDLDQQARRQRRQFGRLVDDGAAGGERRRDLPGRQHEGRVPRRDDADRADRRAGRDVDLAVGPRSALPSRASGARSAKKRKFSAPRSAALAMNFSDWPVSMHSTKAISSARATIASAILCSSFLRASPGIAAQSAEGGLGGLGGAVDVGRLAASDLGQRFQVDRRDRLEGRAVGRRHGLRRRSGSARRRARSAPDRLRPSSDCRRVPVIDLRSVTCRAAADGWRSSSSSAPRRSRGSRGRARNAASRKASTGSPITAAKIASPARFFSSALRPRPMRKFMSMKPFSGQLVGDRIGIGAEGAHPDCAELEQAGVQDRPLDHRAELGHVDRGVEIRRIVNRHVRHALPPCNEALPVIHM